MAKTKTEKSNGANDVLGTGRRKSSVARVRVRPGSGGIIINKRSLEDYFFNQQDRNNVLAPLDHTQQREAVDIIVRVHGGGFSGQSCAIKLGIARALLTLDTELESGLRDAGMLTRDSRAKERKKCGLHGARRGTQFSKR